LGDLLRGWWFRLVGRCFVCDRLMALHTPWALYICERTPLPIQLVADSDPIVPASRASA
jgi:hypothetical protein